MALQGFFKALDQCEIKIIKMTRGEWGEIFFDDNLIHISRDISLDRQLQALLHECLHWRWPNRTEGEILALESTKWGQLKPVELRALLDALYPLSQE